MNYVHALVVLLAHIGAASAVTLLSSVKVAHREVRWGKLRSASGRYEEAKIPTAPHNFKPTLQALRVHSTENRAKIKLSREDIGKL